MRENSSTGPLAKGLSISVFSHGRGRNAAALPECPVNSKYPVHAFRLIRTITRPCHILVWDRQRILGYFRPLPHHVGGRQAVDSARPGGGGGFVGGFGAGAGGVGSKPVGAAAAPRRRSRGGRSDGVAAARGGGTGGGGRALRGAARGRRKGRIRSQFVG